MAQCKDCLHYGVCAKEGRLVQVDEHTWDEYNLLPNVEQFCTSYFTADVVPKSEVEKWFRECEELQGRMIELESEVARKIISTIKENFEIGYGGVCEFNKLLDDIEKKYVKESGANND